MQIERKEIKEIYKTVAKNITGRFAMSFDDACVLAITLEMAGNGNYIEIGTLWGGSVIFAGVIKKRLNISGELYAIDPMNGYYGKPIDELEPFSKDKVIKNFELFNLKVNLVESKSIPFPLDVRANVFLIDGDHEISAVKADWMSAKKHTDGFVLFHDYNYPEIKRFVDGLGADLFMTSGGMAVIKL